MKQSLRITILGLSITSAWGNGHATTFRGLVAALQQKGHSVTFLERDVPWYAANRDLVDPPYCETILYNSIDVLKNQHGHYIKNADLVIVGSYVPEGVAVGELVVQMSEGITAFYDIDTPVTIAKLNKGDFEYLHPELIAKYDIYLSFTGGKTLKMLEEKFHSPMAVPFYCAFDPSLYYPSQEKKRWELGYLGTYSDDRQPPLQRLMLDTASVMPDASFVVAGPQYPASVQWPKNVTRIDHLPPAEHRQFYCSQRYTMNITRSDMVAAGFSPSVRLFEAAACGTPIISDYWEGIDFFFELNKEILISSSESDTRYYLTRITEEERNVIATRARAKVMEHHTAKHRASELESYYQEAVNLKSIQQYFDKAGL